MIKYVYTCQKIASKCKKGGNFMLLRFKTSNFKAFKNEVEFVMSPAKVDEFSYSILEKTYGDKSSKALCTSIIYGPNAAGKTTIINAMSCFKNIILRGNILDDDKHSDDVVSNNMQLIPFAFNEKNEPVMFELEFIFNEHKYKYHLEMDLGQFGVSYNDRKIINEELSVDDYLIFKRTNNDIEVEHLTKISELLLDGFDKNLAKKNLEISKSNLDPKILFLTTDFDSIISKKINSNIKLWLNEYFVVVNKSNIKSLRPVYNLNEDSIYIEKNINDIARESGIIGTDFAYHHTKENKTELVSLIGTKNKERFALPSELVESQGTIRLIGIIPYIFNVFKNGGTLVIDELDASLHPMIIMNILNIFHNDEINKNKAQIIFNTHNPIYLDNQLVRRDEIKFVEKDKDTKASVLYALSDFKTTGPTGVRNTTDYMKNYFINRFGAIENVDLSDIFLNILEEGNKNA